MVEIEKTFGALLKQLPNKSQMDALIDDINKAGLTKGLEFDLFKPGTEVIEDFYAEMPIAIKVLGSYHEFGNFASDLSKLSRIVTLNDLTITLPEANAANKDAKDKNKKENEPSFINLEVTAKTYRYLDDDEIAAKKAALKAKELPK
jgi:type IV pilus assembly protein PilO